MESMNALYHSILYSHCQLLGVTPDTASFDVGDAVVTVSLTEAQHNELVEHAMIEDTVYFDLEQARNSSLVKITPSA